MTKDKLRKSMAFDMCEKLKAAGVSYRNRAIMDRDHRRFFDVAVLFDHKVVLYVKMTVAFKFRDDRSERMRMMEWRTDGVPVVEIINPGAIPEAMEIVKQAADGKKMESCFVAAPLLPQIDVGDLNTPVAQVNGAS
jgi:hypothetical protein